MEKFIDTLYLLMADEKEVQFDVNHKAFGHSFKAIIEDIIERETEVLLGLCGGNLLKLSKSLDELYFDESILEYKSTEGFIVSISF